MASVVDDISSTCVRNVRPPVVSFSPNAWGDYFTHFSLDNQEQEKYVEAMETLKKDVRAMIMAATDNDKLIKLIDTVERLGLGYHFKNEITGKLEKLHQEDDLTSYDLFTTAVLFRLLRQHQYQVSCVVFEKFMDGSKKFKECVSNDGEGLLSLYEAAHARVHGEEILDEAVPFATHHLKRILAATTMESTESLLTAQIERALEQPHYRGALILEIRAYISLYGMDDSREPLLLKLAKLNFNFLQNLYRNEISDLSRWYNKFDIKSKLTHVRDRLVVCYLWGASIHYEPQYTYVRKAIATNVALVTVIDDTYDNYATLEEAQLLTDAFERWDMNEMDRLPDRMKTVYQFVLSVHEDYEREAAKQDKSFVIPYYKESVKQLIRAYNQEQIWTMERQIPLFEDYINNSVIRSCVYVIFLGQISGLKSFTKEIVDWLVGEPKIIRSMALMGRHLDDLGGEEHDNRGGKLLTVFDNYMKEYDLSRQEVRSKFRELVEDGWKKVNAEWVSKSSIPKEMMLNIINYLRMAEVTYKNSTDGFTSPEAYINPKIRAILVEPIAI